MAHWDLGRCRRPPCVKCTTSVGIVEGLTAWKMSYDMAVVPANLWTSTFRLLSVEQFAQVIVTGDAEDPVPLHLIHGKEKVYGSIP